MNLCAEPLIVKLHSFFNDESIAYTSLLKKIIISFNKFSTMFSKLTTETLLITSYQLTLNTLNRRKTTIWLTFMSVRRYVFKKSLRRLYSSRPTNCAPPPAAVLFLTRGPPPLLPVLVDCWWTCAQGKRECYTWKPLKNIPEHHTSPMDKPQRGTISFKEGDIFSAI